MVHHGATGREEDLCDPVRVRRSPCYVLEVAPSRGRWSTGQRQPPRAGFCSTAIWSSGSESHTLTSSPFSVTQDVCERAIVLEEQHALAGQGRPPSTGNDLKLHPRRGPMVLRATGPAWCVMNSVDPVANPGVTAPCVPLRDRGWCVRRPSGRVAEWRDRRNAADAADVAATRVGERAAADVHREHRVDVLGHSCHLVTSVQECRQ